MLVPVSACNPPPVRAEKMSTPGAASCGKVFENEPMRKPFWPGATAPTEITPSAAAGSDAAIS